MNAMRITAIIILIAGALGLIYGSFTYLKDTHSTQIGPLTLSVKEHETVAVPVWAGVGAFVVGGALLAVSLKRR